VSLPRLTAQLVVSDEEAYLAYSVERRHRPNGEWRIAQLLHTRDAGESWIANPMKRSLWSRVAAPLATWPPEDILTIELADSSLAIVFRDEWVPFEPGGESLWRATERGGVWHIRRLRLMDYEGEDSPLDPPSVPLALARTIKPPAVVPAIHVSELE
jgi:hypothetical protein